MKAKYVSVWDGGTKVVTDCEYDPELGIVFEIETADIDGNNLEVCEDEYVLYNEEEIRNFIVADEEDDEELDEEAVTRLQKIVQEENDKKTNKESFNED